jgi:hypothetical protein
MNQERTIELTLKNDQVVTLQFTSIGPTGHQLWQMFATSESLDTVQQLMNMPLESNDNSKKTGLITKMITRKKK